MCGIFFSLSSHGPQRPSKDLLNSLNSRGPDCVAEHTIVLSRPPPGNGDCREIHLSFLSTVLSLRGDAIVSQPLIDETTGSVLCWNGEAWKIGDETVNGNDSQRIFEILLDASVAGTSDAVLDALSSIYGPYAAVFYDARHGRIIYGRDCLGRRSLLKKIDIANQLIISSISDPAASDAWHEVEADGLYVINLPSRSDQTCSNQFVYKVPLQAVHIPYGHHAAAERSSHALILPYPTLNRALPSGKETPLDLDSAAVDSLERSLGDSLSLRVRNIREYQSELPAPCRTHVAVLFSGGLDCSVMARLAHDLLPQDECIDLLNVAFQNPRVHQSCQAEENIVSPYELCPDRVTGRASFAELQRVCPTRTWRFVEINVPYSETLAHRKTVIELMHPHNTEMDLSISYALYFASRGIGETQTVTDHASVPYRTPARVLLSGLGADELFGGYQRHATAFSRHGHVGLLDELELDINRLGKRNLGRDDRVISHSGKEVRFPYLDESLLRWALGAPVWEKCGFGQTDDRLNAASPAIEPGKKVLRLLAWRLGLQGAAVEKKRAVKCH